MGRAQVVTQARVREQEGWRQGRPIEDPEKTKSWGFVTAKPSEFLVHCRGGKVRAKSSGQGATCFKLPWDAVSVIPTSLQRLSFVADQVTQERVGVEVVGLAVYRIADPLLAFRVLNFSFPERAQEKLEETLSAMLVGATRRLVANLSIDEVMQKRKAAVADELLKEVAPVLGGQGRPDDETHQGWGIVLDTIEVQEVKVLSERVFAAMQAPFRAELDRRATEAQARASLTAVENEKAVQSAQATAQSEILTLRSSIERQRKERESEEHILDEERKQQEAAVASRVERDIALTRARADAEVAEAQAALAEERRARETAEQVAEQRRRQEVAQAALAVHDVLQRALEAQKEHQARALEVEREQRQVQAELAALEGEARWGVARREAEVAQLFAEARARELAAEKLPELAAAVGQRIGEVRVTQIGGAGENPYTSLLSAIHGVVDLVRQ